MTHRLEARVRLTFLAATLLLGSACSSLPKSNSTATPALAITDVSIVDVERGGVIADQTVLISGKHIDRVSHSRGAVIPRHAKIVRASGKFLIPGLWDMHSHHQGSGIESLPLFLANGVTGTRDMGSDAEFILPLRARIERGELAGPTLVVAGPILDAAPADWPFRRRVSNAAEAVVAVRALKDIGVDFIKVHDQTPRDAYFAIADEAKRLGLGFAGHVPSSVTVEEATTSGIASIEHLANYRVFLECSKANTYNAALCRPLFARFAAAGVWQTPTLGFFQILPDLFSNLPPPHRQYASPTLLELWRKNQEASKLDAAAIAFLRGANAGALSAIRDMNSAGVQFLAGCDSMVPGFCLHDELEWLTKAGLSPLQALQAATINPARFLRRQTAYGTVEAGKLADLVLLDANPLLDIRNTRRINGVVYRGRFADRSELDGLLAAGARAAPPRNP